MQTTTATAYLSNGFFSQLDAAEHVVPLGLIFIESIDEDPVPRISLAQ
jgi:hypothetical protein